MMANEINILLPDVKDNESLEIKVFSASEQLCSYRLEVFSFDEKSYKKSRADFVKQKIDNYCNGYSLMEISFSSNHQIRLLFKHDV